jgi:hypothetical protein
LPHRSPETCSNWVRLVQVGTATQLDYSPETPASIELALSDAVQLGNWTIGSKYRSRLVSQSNRHRRIPCRPSGNRLGHHSILYATQFPNWPESLTAILLRSRVYSQQSSWVVNPTRPNLTQLADRADTSGGDDRRMHLNDGLRPPSRDLACLLTPAPPACTTRCDTRSSRGPRPPRNPPGRASPGATAPTPHRRFSRTRSPSSPPPRA